MTIDEFIATYQLSMRSVRLFARMDGNATDWDASASHYQVKVYQEGYGSKPALVTQYSMGSAHAKAPKLRDVLDSLAMDARGISTSFEDWCAEYGYDSDSRKALRTYEAYQENAARLRALLGATQYNVLMNEVEGL